MSRKRKKKNKDQENNNINDTIVEDSKYTQKSFTYTIVSDSLFSSSKQNILHSQVRQRASPRPLKYAKFPMPKKHQKFLL